MAFFIPVDIRGTKRGAAGIRHKGAPHPAPTEPTCDQKQAQKQQSPLFVQIVEKWRSMGPKNAIYRLNSYLSDR